MGLTTSPVPTFGKYRWATYYDSPTAMSVGNKRDGRPEDRECAFGNPYIQVTGSTEWRPGSGNGRYLHMAIKNNQKTAANAVVFTNNLPPSLQFSSASTSLGTCSTPAPGAAGGTVSCNTSTLNGGSTMTVTINVIATQAGSIADTGVASFTGTDSNPANNSFTVTINPK